MRASPMFSQIEGFMVDRAGIITMAHLKGANRIPAAFFGTSSAVRFDPRQFLPIYRTQR